MFLLNATVDRVLLLFALNPPEVSKGDLFNCFGKEVECIVHVQINVVRTSTYRGRKEAQPNL